MLPGLDYLSLKVPIKNAWPSYIEFNENYNSVAQRRTQFITRTQDFVLQGPNIEWCIHVAGSSEKYFVIYIPTRLCDEAAICIP